LGNALKFPWAGGLNYPQFSELDYDYDGDQDLIAFDRSNDQLRVFEHSVQSGQHSYRWNPYGGSLFPSDVRYRMYLADYNLDGKNDLFTYGIGGVKVYRNTGSLGTGLQWTLEKNLLYSDYNGLFMGLYVSSADIPAIVDVDGDQDLDILTFSIAGDHVEYHKNMSKEMYGHCDSLIFELKNRCWGGFNESVTTNAITLFSTSSLCSTGNVPNPEMPEIIKPEDEEKAHAGSTLLALDFDNNQVLDLLIGDVAYGNLNKLVNGGTNPNTNSAMVSVDPAFPSNSVPLNLQLFPGAYYVDVERLPAAGYDRTWHRKYSRVSRCHQRQFAGLIRGQLFRLQTDATPGNPHRLLQEYRNCTTARFYLCRRRLFEPQPKRKRFTRHSHLWRSQRRWPTGYAFGPGKWNTSIFPKQLGKQFAEFCNSRIQFCFHRCWTDGRSAVV